ncbi:MAG: hypothetical protein ACFFCX_02765 [Candidatus Sifarchaeia archaeon]
MVDFFAAGFFLAIAYTSISGIRLDRKSRYRDLLNNFDLPVVVVIVFPVIVEVVIIIPNIFIIEVHRSHLIPMVI